MENYINEYIKNVYNNYSKNTIDAYKNDLFKFYNFINKNKIEFKKINNKTIYFYVSELKKQDNSNRTIERTLVSIRLFYKYLYDKNSIDRMPSIKITLSKDEKMVPNFLSIPEIDTLLNAMDLNTIKGIRDKAILELMYATGLKISELLNLKLDEVNLKVGYLKTIGLKGKERIVPIGEYAKYYLEKYLEIRDELNSDIGNTVLFLNLNGGQMSRQGFWKILKAYINKCNINKNVNLNSIRHSFAVHLLQNGMDMKSLQQLLGYRDIRAIENYLNCISKNKLAEEYKKAHPRA